MPRDENEQVRRLSVILCLVFGALGVGIIVASPASAALCARWDPPEAASRGRSASISFGTYAPVSTGGATYRLEPHPFPDYPFRVLAVSPTGSGVSVDVAPTDSDGSQWSGAFTPDEGGSWTLQIANLADADAACYADIPLDVTEASWGSRLIYAMIGLTMVALIGGLVILGRRRARVRAASGKGFGFGGAHS
jgi:hypothetical protein